MPEPPDAGRILLEGMEISSGQGTNQPGVDVVRRRVGMVFQQFNLFPHMAAIENVSLAQRKVLNRGRARPGPKPPDC
jgi:polar amino acid transport system ATP-binding protein